MPDGPEFSIKRQDDRVTLALAGRWTVDESAAIEARGEALAAACGAARAAVFDLGRITRLDTAGAWLIGRASQSVKANGVEVRVEGLRPEFDILLREARYHEVVVPPRAGGSYLFRIAADIGETVVSAGADIYRGIGFLG